MVHILLTRWQLPEEVMWNYFKDPLTDSCIHSHIAKEVKIWHLVTYIILHMENENNSTCKFGYILDVYSLCFTRCKIKRKYKQKQIKRKTEKQEQKKEKNTWLWLILPKCVGSVNCASSVRVTSNIYRVHFWFFIK